MAQDNMQQSSIKSSPIKPSITQASRMKQSTKQTQIDQMSVLDRAIAPTPAFFRALKLIGSILAILSGAILAIPIPLPAIFTTIAALLAVAGTVAVAVSQLTVKS